MASNLPPQDEAKLKLVSIFMQAWFYGVLVVLVALSHWLFKGISAARSRAGNLLFSLLLALFLLQTMHVSVNFTRIIKGFIIFGSKTGDPKAYFDETSNFTNVFACAIYVIQAIVGELFFLYRTALILEKRWWFAILPLLFFITSTLAGIGNIDAFVHVTTEKIFMVQHTHWKFFFAFAFSGNFTCTGLIGLELHEKNKLLTNNWLEKSWQMLLVMVDTGAIYSGTLFALLVAHLTTTTTEYLLLDAFSPILPIAAALIFIRLNFGLCTVEGRMHTLQDIDEKYSLGGITLVSSRGASRIDDKTVKTDKEEA